MTKSKKTLTVRNRTILSYSNNMLEIIKYKLGVLFTKTENGQIMVSVPPIGLGKAATIFCGFVATCSVVGFLGGFKVTKELQVKQKQELYLMEKAKIYLMMPETFEAKVRKVAAMLKVQPEWLMAVMYSESRFNAQAENFRGSGAVGLIQFMPATAREMGTSTAALSRMTHEEQLDWVYAYMEGYRKKYGDYKSLCDFYLGILYPRARTGDMCYVLYESPSKAYKQNSGLDEDKDGRVTVGDIDKRMKRLYPSAYVAGQKDNLNDTITVYKTEFVTNE